MQQEYKDFAFRQMMGSRIWYQLVGNVPTLSEIKFNTFLHKLFIINERVISEAFRIGSRLTVDNADIVVDDQNDNEDNLWRS